MDRADGELPVTGAAVLGGDVQRPQPALASFSLELRAQSPWDVALQQELLLERREALLAELARGGDQPLHVVGEVEVHAGTCAPGWKSVRTAVSEPSAYAPKAPISPS